MAQILASSKVPANKYDNFSVDPNKVLPRVDIQQLAANFKEAYEVFQGYSLSGDEGSNEAIANLLSIIGVGDVDTYKDSFTKMIQTAVSNASRLEVDGASTANAIILNEPTIGNPVAPDGNDYTKSVPLPFEYVDGLSFIFRATANNTGSTTIQIPNLTGLAGAVDLLDEQENSLLGGEIVANKYYKIVAKTVSTVKKFLLVERINTQFSKPNLIINGQGLIGQRGTSFDSTTTPANNDDTYLLDRMLLLSDGNDIVDVSQETTEVPSGAYSSIKFDVETANKQFAYCQILEAKDAAKIIGGTASLSFKAKKGGSNVTLETLRAAIISWDSTEDIVTSDVIATWAGSGTDPTLATNWTYENTPSNLTLTTSFQTFKIENVSIDTASTANVAVLIWCDDTDATVGDLAYIGDIKLEEGQITTPYESDNIVDLLVKCKRYYETSITNVFYGISTGGASSQIIDFGIQFSETKRVPPSISDNFVAGTGAYAGSTRLTTNIGVSQFRIRISNSPSTSAGGDYNWQVDAEL